MNQLTRFFIFLFLCLSLTIAAQNSPEQLLLFVNGDQAVLSQQDQLAIQELAAESALTLKVVDIQQGAPVEITYTPALVFQNHLGRSYYYGRYKNLSRLRNFIRTSRLAHQKNTENLKKEILVWENQRAAILAPIKITALNGTLPKGHNATAFLKEMELAVSKQMDFFQQIPTFSVQRNTRSFYVNLYPYLDAKKNLTLSAELFSQYNCVQPVFQQYEQGLVCGKWKDRASLFAKAGKLMEQEIIRQIEASDIGDAFAPIPKTVPTTAWEALGLQLPNKASKTLEQRPDVLTVPQLWEVAPSENKNEPLIIFSFLPPLDNYAGEAKALSGTFKLAQAGQVQGATGKFEVQIKDVTMGAADFDSEVQNKMLQQSKFPSSNFTIQTIEANNQSLEIGQVTNIKVYGTFELLGKTIPLELPAQIEPFFNSSGELRLQINTSFKVPLFEHFNVGGPDGPSPAKDTLQFFMKFHLQPS